MLGNTVADFINLRIRPIAMISLDTIYNFKNLVSLLSGGGALLSRFTSGRKKMTLIPGGVTIGTLRVVHAIFALEPILIGRQVEFFYMDAICMKAESFWGRVQYITSGY